MEKYRPTRIHQNGDGILIDRLFGNLAKSLKANVRRDDLAFSVFFFFHSLQEYEVGKLIRLFALFGTCVRSSNSDISSRW